MGKSKTGLSIVNLSQKGNAAYGTRLCRPETHVPDEESGKDCTGSSTCSDTLPPVDPGADLPEANGHLPGTSEVTRICCDFPEPKMEAWSLESSTACKTTPYR